MWIGCVGNELLLGYILGCSHQDDKNFIFSCNILKFTRPGWVAMLLAGGRIPNVNVILTKLKIFDIEFAFNKLYIQKNHLRVSTEMLNVWK